MTTPEESQKILDLRHRMLENVRNGRAPEDGIDEATIHAAIASVSARRASAATSAAKKNKRIISTEVIEHSSAEIKSLFASLD